MKYLLLILSFHFSEGVFGQITQDTTISKWTLDSLKNELWNRSETINRMKWAYVRKGNNFRIDTIFIREDSMVINHRTEENKVVFQESINLRKVSFKKDLCKGLIVHRYFNEKEQPEYIEYWDGLCYDESKKDDDEKYFDSNFRKLERIIYNNVGQKIRRVTTEILPSGRWWTYQFAYQFENGKEVEKMRKIDHFSFWD